MKIQSQLRSLVTSVDNSIVADNIEFAGDIFYVLYVVSGIPSKVNISLYNLAKEKSQLIPNPTVW